METQDNTGIQHYVKFATKNGEYLAVRWGADGFEIGLSKSSDGDYTWYRANLKEGIVPLNENNTAISNHNANQIEHPTITGSLYPMSGIRRKS